MSVTAACGSSGGGGAPDAGGGDAPSKPDQGAPPVDAATEATTSDGGGEAGPSACAGDTLAANRNRLLETYYEYLKANATTPQSNGLSSSNVSSALDVWKKLDPSSQAVFLTLTARMQGSHLRTDASSMLSHVTKIYRITGGQGATATDPGSCGGGEYNRMIMSMDAELQGAQLAANQDQGASPYDISDVVSSSYWRDSHDVGGPHAPFDISDETNGGAPRGQTQYFSDPKSTLANSPLGRQDLMTLVDPYAIEMDQDYDCVHNSNPLCDYITYGPACFPETQEVGTQVYTDSYGDYGASYSPQACP